MSVMMHISSRRASPLARLIAFMALTARLTITLILTAVPMGKIPRARSSLERLRRRGTFRPRDFTITEPALRQAFDQGLRRFFVREPYLQPLQIDLIILSTFASSRSMTGLVPRSGPF